MEKLPDGRRPDGGPPDGARPEGERPHPRRVRPGRRERSVCVEGAPPPAPRSPSSSSHLLDPTRERPHRRRVRESPAGVRHPEQECPPSEPRPLRRGAARSRPHRGPSPAAPPPPAPPSRRRRVPRPVRVPRPRRARPPRFAGGVFAPRHPCRPRGVCRRRRLRSPPSPPSPRSPARRSPTPFAVVAFARSHLRHRRGVCRRRRVARRCVSPSGPRSGRRRVAIHTCRCRDPHGVTLAVHAAPAEVAGLSDAAFPPGRDRRRHCVCRSPGVHGAAPCSPPPPSGPGGPDHAAAAAPASRRARAPAVAYQPVRPFDSAEAGGRRRSRRPRTTPAASAAPGVPPRLRPCCFRSARPSRPPPVPALPPALRGRGAAPGRSPRSDDRRLAAGRPVTPVSRRSAGKPSRKRRDRTLPREPPARNACRPPPGRRQRGLARPRTPGAFPEPPQHTPHRRSRPPAFPVRSPRERCPADRPPSRPGTLRAAVGPRPAAEFPAVGVPAPGLRRLTWGSAV